MKTATDYKVFDKFSVYDDLWMELNNRGKWPVNNRVMIPMDIKSYSTNFKATMSMNSLTSGTIIAAAAQDWLRVQVNKKRQYIDTSYFYSLSISNLLYCVKSSCQGKSWTNILM